MKTEADWLKKHVEEYRRIPITTLLDMLKNTTDTIKQYIDNPNLATTKGLLECCERCNRAFLQEVEN